MADSSDVPAATDASAGGASGAALGLPTVPTVEAVDHVGVAVPDLEAAIAFHVHVLGLELRHRERNEEQRVEEAMLAAPGAAPGQTAVQLLAPLGEDSPIAKFLNRAGPGLQQLAYRVSDVEAAAAALRGRGLRVLYETARTGTGGSMVNFVHPADCGGVLVEIVQSRAGAAPSV